MGSSRHNSAHLKDVKGKGIFYEDDDAPIKLMDADTNDFRLSLIGKILNPKKQNVDKLISKMPSQWGMEDRLTANDLGNGKFLLNFTFEEDLNSVLRQGPFHFNFCMFVLVRWEPIVHDDYPWVIPFWVRLIGVPLHLWMVRNLEDIGSRLGHVDTLELAEGCMLIDIDTRRPLKFKRKVESPEEDEVTIEIKYYMLFKHCSTCGMLTHEKEYCPSNDVMSRIQQQEECPGVFAQMQPPTDQTRGHHLSRDLRVRRPHYPLTQRNDTFGHGHNVKRSNRYESYHGARGPYDRRQETTWKPKEMPSKQDNTWTKGPHSHHEETRIYRVIVPYEHTSGPRAKATQGEESTRLGEAHNTRRLASTIVTPSRDQLDENVTKHTKDITRALSFTSLDENERSSNARDDMMIGALDDMDVEDKHSGEMMECDVENDDLLGMELNEMENKAANQDRNKDKGRSDKVPSSSKRGPRAIVPLGFPTKKIEILRRGSPRKHASRSHGAPMATVSARWKSRHMGSKKQKSGASKHDGEMGSKNSSHNHL